ncbi:SH3 domain-containing protein [Yoonia sp. 208BN28-4]|uniref:SH3 domain-containing protein n=1 Tax=Yoonia sp. 208BN28-4 TaxID=3126505 RepID=UPI0030990490
MGKFIIATFLLLGWGFYELSGGAEFEPEPWPTQVAAVEVEALPSSDVADAVEVTRADTTDLNNVAPTQSDDQQLLVALQTAPAEETPGEAPVVAEAETAIVEETPQEAVAEAPAALDLRAVAGSRVNMREGPGTNFGVIDTIDGGTQAEVIEVNADGWARIRLTGTNQTGWMAERLLSPI